MAYSVHFSMCIMKCTGADAGAFAGAGAVCSRASEEYFIDNSSLWLPLSCLPLGMLKWNTLREKKLREFFLLFKNWTLPL